MRTDGHAERVAAKIMINDARQAVQDASSEITLGAVKGYDAQEFIEACHEMKVTPHVAQNTAGRRWPTRLPRAWATPFLSKSAS